MTLLTWLGIAFCISQSALFSGSNLAFFTLGKLELELEARKGNPAAEQVLKLRQDANFLLVTILWGNVAINVLLALLSGSVMTALGAFLFSTFLITIFGEIMPQAYFSRHALKVASLFAPIMRGYQLLLYPVARPTALALDKWLGPEALRYYKERDLREIIKMHMESRHTEIDRLEGQGAMNFLTLDDVPLSEEGESIDPDSIVQLPFRGDQPQFPAISASSTDPFLQRLNRSGRKWAVLIDQDGSARLVVNTDKFTKAALFDERGFDPRRYCHRPVITDDRNARLGVLIPHLKVLPDHSEDDVVDNDVILLWGNEKRILTGADILGRLLRGIVRNSPSSGQRTSRAAAG